MGQVVPLKMDVDKKDVAAIAEKYKVSVIPAIFFLDENGKIKSQFVGFKSPSDFSKDLLKYAGAGKAPSKKKR